VANQFIQVPPNSTGLKVQTFENTVGANVVESEAVTLVRSSDNTEVGTSGQPLRIDPVGTTTQPVSGSVTATQATGSNLHVVVDTAPTTTVTGSGNFNVVGTTADGATTETAFLVIGGESNDATAQYQPIPLGTTGRSVIVEGVSGGTVVPVSLTSTTITSTVAVTESGTWTNRIVGNAGATLDQAQGSAVPTNGLMVGGGSIAGATNFEALTVKAASTAAAATDTSLVVQPLVNSHTMNTAAAGTQLVGIVGNAAATLDQVNGSAVPTNGLQVGGGSVAGGTNFTVLTVKAASTAAAATDTSLVVQPLVGSHVMNTAAAGTQLVGIVGNTAATIDGVLNGAAPTNTLWATPNPSSASAAACTLFQNSAVTTAQVVKASAGNLYGYLVNGGTSGNFLQFINAASAPTLGTNAVFSVQIPAAGLIVAMPAAMALNNFTTGISLGISTTYNGASAGTAASVVAFYK
jgi:hypothetical protein